VIPKSIYELLPTAYLVGGTASATTMPVSYGVASGILLAICGYVIGTMRERYRVKHAAIIQNGCSRYIGS
jgi:hypothetical protein